MIGSEEIKSEDQVKLVGVLIDNKLSYDEYISTCLKNASAKLNSIKRLGNFLSKHQKKVLGYSYVLSYFKYCPIVWHFGNISNTHKTEKLHERVIRFIHSDYENNIICNMVSNFHSRIFFFKGQHRGREGGNVFNCT